MTFQTTNPKGSSPTKRDYAAGVKCLHKVLLEAFQSYRHGAVIYAIKQSLIPILTMPTMLRDITTNSPDVPEDKMSADEMNEWSINAMKELCCTRDFKVSAAKKELATRVYIL